MRSHSAALPYPEPRRSSARAALGASAVLCALVALAGCASIPPPVTQLAVSKAALAEAVKAGGPEYAPSEMRSSRDKLDQANLAMGKESYTSARQLAEESEVDAQAASAKARSSKAQKAALQVQDDSRVLRQEIDRKNN